MTPERRRGRAQTPRIRGLRYMGPAPRPHRGGWRLIGQDGGQSIALDQATLFVFSDTLLALSAGNGRSPKVGDSRRGIFLANSAGVATRGDLFGALGSLDYFTDDADLPREILVPTAAEKRRSMRFWPLHGVFLNGVVYLYYLGVRTVDATAWGFRNVGVGLARLDPESGDCERLRCRDEWRWWPGLAEDDLFGVQVLRQGDQLYVFGSERRGYSYRARLARVASNAIADPEAYQVLAAASPTPRWSHKTSDAVDMGPSGSTYSVSYNHHLRCYLMLYIDEYLKILTMRTAPEPWGPYSLPKQIARVPHDPASELVYMGFEHPELCREQGRQVYLTYSQPRFLVNSLLTVRWR